jgi:predicted dehydrogenase
MSEQNGRSRREFLKNSAGIVAASTVAGGLLSSSVYAAGDETIKIALIGCGGRGGGACGQALSTPGPVKLIAVADAFEDNARNKLKDLKNQFGDKVDVKEDHIFSGFDAYKQAIDCGIDLILIATPPGFRPIHFDYAVQQGKNVFMEKPIATDAAGVRKVIAAAEEAKKKNLKVAVGLQRHHQARYIETVKRIQDGALGDLILMRAYWNDAGVWVRPRQPQQTEMEYQMRNWYYFLWLCGDHINEQHIHNLDVINWIKGGPPVEAHGMGGRQFRNGIDHGEIFDHFCVEYTYKDGTKLHSECRHIPNCWSSVSEHAHGIKGHSDVGGGSFKMTDGSSDWRYRPAKGKDADPYQQEHDDLFDNIRNNKEQNEAFYGASSTMTSLLGRMATYSGKPLTYEQALNSKIDLMPETFAWDALPRSLPDAHGRYKIPMPGITKVIDDTI